VVADAGIAADGRVSRRSKPVGGQPGQYTRSVVADPRQRRPTPPAGRGHRLVETKPRTLWNGRRDRSRSVADRWPAIHRAAAHV